MPGASARNGERSALNIAARYGLYVMLAFLVVASFIVAPERRASGEAVASATAAPAVTGVALSRAAPAPRGFNRLVRDLEGAAVDPSPASVAQALAPAVDVLDATASLAAADAAPVPEPMAPAPEAAPDPTPAPPARPAPRAPMLVSPTTLLAEARMLELINASRLKAGLVPLTADAQVASAARAHSGAEAQVRYVYHDGPDGTAAARNAPACQTGWYGENTGKIWNGNVDALHVEFMAEPWAPINHRTNIMDPAFRRVGVGAVIGPDAMYMTMVFCR